MSLTNQAKIFAKEKHESVNQIYDGRSYILHLELVQFWLSRFIEILNHRGFDLSQKKIELLESVAWLHDTLEDTNISYNDLKSLFDFDIAEAVFLLTEEKGRNRAERHNHKYMTGISSNSLASIVKIADIAANASYSFATKSSMFSKYKKEFPSLKYYLQYTDKEVHCLLQHVQDFFDSDNIDVCVEQTILMLRTLYPVRYSLTVHFDSSSAKEECLQEIKDKFGLAVTGNDTILENSKVGGCQISPVTESTSV